MIGKVLGALIGFRLGGPIGAFVGLMAGHFVFDENISKKSKKKSESPKQNLSELEIAYDALGLKTNASIFEIKSAYRKKCKELHPDLLQNKGLGESAMKALETELRRVTDAYNTILRFKNAKN